MKIRISPFTKDATYFYIQYKFDGLFSSWNRLEENYISSLENLCEFNFPMLFESFESAESYARELTEEKIKKYNEDRLIEYNKHINSLRDEIKKRYITKEFTI